MYQITPHVASHRLDVDFIGEYADIDQAALSRDLRAGVARVKGRSEHFDLLCDFSQIHVMPQNRVAQSQEEIEWCLANGLRKSANVVSGMISRMQIERMTANDRFRMFTSRAEAIAWLNAPD